MFWIHNSRHFVIGSSSTVLMLIVATAHTEHHDLAKKMPQKVAAMKARVLELTPTLFNPDRCHPYKVVRSPTGVEFCDGYYDHSKAAAFFGGFPGPYMPPYMQPI